MENLKRSRSVNFSKSEVRLLIELVAKYRSILENKKTDAVTNKDKNAAWNKITSSFNAATDSPVHRNVKTLRLKYEGVKKETKKKMSKHRQELYRSGGDPSSDPNFDDVDEKILGMCSNITGLEARYDSDNIPELPQSKDIIPINIKSENILKCTFIEEDSCEDIGETSDKKLFLCVPNDVDIDNDGTNKDNKWKTWNAKALKTKKTQVLRPANKTVVKVTKAGVTEKLDKLTSARLELVELQKDVAKMQCQFLEEEHNIKMLHLNNEEKRKQELHELILKKMH